ncbi:DUF4328 domain-containing protein [Microbacterium sp. NPDC057659]|uniref:DUF4328 domain-containing protein n=1 Tax=Microbacterium sp. NPDC057659 TaxID=3346198 RepID=UPI0036723E25
MPEPAVLRPLRSIGAATRWLVAATALMSVVTIAVDASGLAAIDAFVAGTAGVEALDAYDRASQPAALAWSAVYIAAAVCWLVWQYRAAASVDPIYLQRSKGWHVGSWFVPLMNWWWPFQNVKDLVWGSRAAVKPAVLGVWWALWLAANLVSVFASRQLLAAETPESFSAALSFSILGDALLIVTAAFAWIIVKRITDALDPVAR